MLAEASQNKYLLDRATHALVVLFCLFLFPSFIIYASFNRLYLVKIENLRNETGQQLINRLDILDNFSSNRRYFHQLFRKIFTIADRQADPIEYLNKNLINLRRRYPDCFEFIVWDGNGKVMAKLTDQQGYKFILARLFETLLEVRTSMAEDMSIRVADLPVFVKNRNLISKFIGRFFIAEHLKLPYLQGVAGGPARVDFSQQRSDYWFQVGDKLAWFVFFNQRILDRNDGLIKLIETSNRNSPNQITGYVAAPDLDRPLTAVPDELKADLHLALARFENYDRSLVESEKALIAVKNSAQNLRIFSIFPKNQREWSAKVRTAKSFVRVMLLALPFYLMTYWVVFVLKAFVSIRLKLMSVFLFANVIPLIVLSFIGYDFIASKEAALRHQFVDNSLALLRNFDSRLEKLKHSFHQEILRACLDMNQAISHGREGDEVFTDLREVVASVKPSEAYLVSSGSRKIFEWFPENSPPTHSNKYAVPMFAAALNFINGRPVSANESDYLNALLSPAHSEVIRYARRNSGRIFEINTGNSLKTAFQYAFGIPGKTAYNFFLMMLWDHNSLGYMYIDRSIDDLNRFFKDSKVFIRSANGARHWPEQKHVPEQVRGFLEKLESSTGSLDERVVLGGSPHIIVGLRGRQLENIVMASVIPEGHLGSRIARIKVYIFLAIVLNLFLTITISVFLSRQFMLPINQLEAATVAISRGDFRHRLTQLDNDELGYLGSVFNRVTEGLGDLEVARVVQESLFPGNRFAPESFAIYGRSIVMTTLGGDYYDCFPIDEENWAMVIGDVAGHGVPAGLMMAMAKAGILTASPAQQLDPTLATGALHRIFHAIKNANMKRMMTFQYFVLNSKSGEMAFANAGHCFPLLIDPATAKAEFIEHVATPLGVGARARYRNMTFTLNPGQSLILYTDGLAEAKNSSGQDFGYERIMAVLPGLYHPDPEIFYERIVQTYKSWSAVSDDDLTIIVCNRTET